VRWDAQSPAHAGVRRRVTVGIPTGRVPAAAGAAGAPWSPEIGPAAATAEIPGWGGGGAASGSRWPRRAAQTGHGLIRTRAKDFF
jgi:hypothetical protein